MNNYYEWGYIISVQNNPVSDHWCAVIDNNGMTSWSWQDKIDGNHRLSYDSLIVINRNNP